jgi:hypothetical protein
MGELTPRHVLADLLDGIEPQDSIDLRMPKPKEAAAAVIQRLIDAGFGIRPAA